MTMTVRLNSKTERALEAMAKRRGVSRSDVVREALVRYEAEEGAPRPSRPFEAWQHVIGVVALGVRDPARTTGEQLAEIVSRQGKRARRSR